MGNMARTRFLVATVAIVAIALTATAGGKWLKLGERVVNDKLDHDNIYVGADRGDFTALKLKVVKRPVHFLDMKVYFANGGVQDVQIRKVIPAGGETRVIDLRGSDRVIKRVQFWYEAETPKPGKKSKVRLFGRR